MAGTKRKHGEDTDDAPEEGTSSSNAPDGSAAVPDVLTVEGDMPQKKFYRARAHCNPLSFNETFEYPARPDLFDWTGRWESVTL